MRWQAWVGVALSALVAVGAVIYWRVDARLNAPLRPADPAAEAELRAEIDAQNEAAFFQPPAQPREVAPPSETRNVYFGDLHVHTKLSFDAYLFGTRLDPDLAYRIAKGEPAALITGETVRLTRPLDFVALTDHAEGFGLHEACVEPINEIARKYCTAFDEPSLAFFLALRGSGERRPPVRDLSVHGDDPEVAARNSRSTWEAVRAAAERHYEPGRFTTFAGYEYSPVLADTGKHHRNIIFRSAATPDSAVSAYDAASEIDLWRELERTCTGDCEFLTIPHNPNKSWGLAFASETIDGVPYGDADWRLRARSEPIVEMFQIKGNSECSSAFGANDEECGFEQFLPPCAAGQETLCIHPTSMIRDGLKIGLSLEAELGINPLRFGLIGATDTHNANPGDTEEWDYRGSAGYNTSPARRRLAGGRGGNRPSLQRNPGGLAAVWAVENTRESLFDAMRRREVYATSGTRMRLRVFADYRAAETEVATDADLRQLYSNGVPMGGVLPAREGDAPAFFIWALKDQDHAPLAKAQVVKGWRNPDGSLSERVFDVACAGARGADGRCELDASVDLNDCGWAESAGAAELKTWWRDPDYDPAQSAFYYVRVAQIPTCRWSTYDALRLDLPPPEGVPATVQEMAWASPIWVRPE
ncbi:MAG: DUF3604 domain-containing protein [Pseudomonadota bacterium]